MGHNRIIHLESFIKEGKEYFEQTLLQNILNKHYYKKAGHKVDLKYL
jgi:hypothetical protein